MFSLKARALILFIALWYSVPNGTAMPTCGVCTGFDPGPSGLLRQSSVPSPALGEKKVLYIRMNYPDDTSEPVSAAAAATLMTQVSDFYRAHSYGQFGTATTVTPLVQVPRAKDTYFVKEDDGAIRILFHDLLNHARAAASDAGYDPADYDLHVVRFNAPTWQSFANVGYPGAWMVSSDVPTTVHEIGHNLGLRHANLWNGPLNGAGFNDEYGDQYDIMGGPLSYREAGFNSINKTALGWLSTTDTEPITQSGVYRIYAHDVLQTESNRRYLLRISKDLDRDYWIEKRQSIDTSQSVENGLLVYWDNWPQSNLGTHLLNATDDPGDALPLRKPLIDAVANVRVFPLHQGEDRSYVDVAVILGSAKLNILPGLLHFTGAPNQNCLIQTSNDLRTWVDLTTISAATGENFLPIDAQSAHTFYRVVEAPLFK